jgi:hypothetical protein
MQALRVKSLDFEENGLCIVSQLTEGPLHLAEGPSTTDIVCLHLNITHYNSPGSDKFDGGSDEL